MNALGSKTHTSGFTFQPVNKDTKFSPTTYGDDALRAKYGGGKDFMKTLNASNGFGSGYSSDPYTSGMSSGLPATFNGSSNRPSKGKIPQNKGGTKEKEQLYDETIKMKVVNNQLREEMVKLKTKLKMLENELSRKEKTIEDLFNNNQMIQHSQSKQSSSNQSLMPLA